MESVIGCLVLAGCCGSCFFCGRGCRGNANTQVREPSQQPARIVVAPVAVSPAIVSGSTPASIPAGYLVVTDPVTGQHQLYAPVAPLTPTSAAEVLASSGNDTEEQAAPTVIASETTSATQADNKTPLLRD